MATLAAQLILLNQSPPSAYLFLNSDLATYTSIEVRWLHVIDIDLYPNVKRWFESIYVREPVRRTMALLREHEGIGSPSDETREVLFGR